jgi:hypothetical protein
MDFATWTDSTLTQQRLAALELRHRKALADLTGARASYSSVSDAARVDELEMRRALARVQHLQGQIADLQMAIEVLEDGVTA